MPEDIRDFTPKQMRALSPDVISKLPDRAMAVSTLRYHSAWRVILPYVGW